jgi:farnesyl-diphosphate farnesyltransferase
MADQPVKFCEKILKKVSRSFALTIPMLDDKLYRPVMITYLQDRLLDNFEDEVDGITLAQRKFLMDRVVEIFNPDNPNPSKAIEIIEGNAELILDKHLRRLTENASILYEAYIQMAEPVKEISFQWLEEMNQGMKDFLDRQVETFTDLDRYCYYVAGTVGGFLSDLIIEESYLTSKESQKLKDNFTDAGLFLQKVNLIRDIKKDIEKRDKNFWPLKSLEICEDMILDKEYKTRVMKAQYKMLEDVKQHIEGLVSYMEAIPNYYSGYKKFFCVNNTLGLATLEEIEGNEDLFYSKKKVKVSKIDFVKIINSPEKMFYKKADYFLKNTVVEKRP